MKYDHLCNLNLVAIKAEMGLGHLLSLFPFTILIIGMMHDGDLCKEGGILKGYVISVDVYIPLLRPAVVLYADEQRADLRVLKNA